MSAGHLYHGFKRIDERWDAIVIGSGIGGLGVAAILAKAGKKVLVLERHYEVGGYTHTFQRKGYTWDVGVHYIGQVHIPGTLTHKTFRYVTNDQLKWAELDNVYDRAIFGEQEFQFVKGRENLRKALKAYFPHEKDHIAIDRYFRLLKEVEEVGISFYIEKVLPPFLSRLIGGLLRRKLLRYAERTTREVLQSITDNERLIGVLTAQYGDYGLPPGKSSFYMHALLANHYLEGAAYPVGGAKQIAACIAPVIEQAGGAVLFYAEVKQILVENNTAIGVEMMDGEKLYGDYIISDAGIVNTFSRLLPEETRRQHHLEEKLQELEPSVAHTALYLGFKGSVQELGIPACNYWVFPNEYNHDLLQEKYTSIEQDLPVAYISFPAAKDPDWQAKHPDRSTVEVITGVPYEWFKKWEGTDSHRRGEAYETMKQKIADQMLEVLYRVQPKLKGKLEHMEISTPLSTKKFTNHPKGEIYGAALTPKRFQQRFLRPATPVKHLYLTGQDITVASIAGGLIGAVLCASVVLKRNVLSQIERTVR